MQDCKSVDITEEELRQFSEFKQRRRIEEARAAAQKLELDLLAAVLDKASVRFDLKEAARLNLGAVCVPPNLVRFCSQCLGQDTPVSVIACISCPNGADTTDIKVKAVKRAINDGADEVEVTAPLLYIKEGSWGYVKKEFKKIKKAAKKRAARINVEAPLFTEAEIKKLCSVAADIGIVCLRTACNTPSADTDADVRLILANGKDKLTVKAGSAVDFTAFLSAVNSGAAKVSSPNALQLAAQILANINE